MFIIFMYGGFLAVTVIQLLLCRKCKKKRLRFAPAVFLVLAMCTCIMGFRIATEAGSAYRELAFSLDWYSVVFGFWLVGDGLAWLIHGLIKLAQKIRNFFVM